MIPASIDTRSRLADLFPLKSVLAVHDMTCVDLGGKDDQLAVLHSCHSDQ